MVTHLSEAIVCQAVCGNVDGSNRITTNFTITFRHRPLGCLQGPQVSCLQRQQSHMFLCTLTCS